ncbi:MAG: type II toxin-antitoxin system PemK/MazF family toxin [bacterium]
MVIARGDVWWADLPAPTGAAPGFRLPVVVVQNDALNRSRLATVVCVPLTSNLAGRVSGVKQILASGYGAGR